MHSTPENPPPATTKVSSRALRRVFRDDRFLQRVDQMVSQPQRVAQVLERNRMFLEPRHYSAGQSGSERQHEMIEMNLQVSQRMPRREPHAAPLEVDGLDRTDVQLGLRDDAPNRADDVQRFECSRNHFR